MSEGPKRQFWRRRDRQLHKQLGLFVPPGHTKAPVKNSCGIVITAKPGTNGLVLRVRCRCMAQVNLPWSGPGYYQYDWLAEVISLEEAVKVWKEHHETES